jgi:hypothetical protein
MGGRNRAATSFNLPEVQLMMRVLDASGEAGARALSKRLSLLATRIERGVINPAKAARDRHDRVREAFLLAAKTGRPWSNHAFADASGISYAIVTRVVRECRLIAGLRGVRLAPVTASRVEADNSVCAIYATLRDANQWGPWQLQPVAALAGVSVDVARKSVKAAVRVYPIGDRYEGGLPALLRDLGKVEYVDANVEAAE